MSKRLVALLGLSVTCAGAFAATNIKLVDWATGPADGAAAFLVPPEVVALSHATANVTYLGQIWGTRPGIQQYDIQLDVEAAPVRRYVLCVELEEGLGNTVYGYKTVSGYVGYLAAKIPGIVGGSDPGNIKSAALALATWELDYDAYDPFTNSVNVANLNLSTGLLQYVQTGESAVDYAAIRAQADQYLVELQGLDPLTIERYAYMYFVNPYGNDPGKGFQDYVGTPNPVPEPASLAAILVGCAGLVLRRRRSARP